MKAGLNCLEVGIISLLTTWLMLETLDWRMVTASPMDGFLFIWGLALKALVAREVIL
jgi:hypothetical protein